MITLNIKNQVLLWIVMGFLWSFSSVQAQAPVNDLCSNATVIAIGGSQAGTTYGATQDNAAYCQATITGPGVWYQLTGTGGAIKVSTCANASFDTKLGVYSGSCGTLNCVAGNDDSPACAGFTSEVEFISNIG